MGKAVKSVGGALGFGSAPKIGVPGSVKAAKIREEEQKKFAKEQRGTLDPLRDQASGRAPSLAEAAMKSAQDRSLAQQVATARSGRGGNTAAQQRNLARSQAQAGTQIAQQAAMAKLQERQSAQAALRDELSRQRQQNLQLEQARSSALLGQGSAQMGVAQANQAAQQAQQSRLAGTLGGIAGSAAGTKLLGAAGSAISGLFSDKEGKKNIKKEDKKSAPKAKSAAESFISSSKEAEASAIQKGKSAISNAQSGIKKARAALSDESKKKNKSKEKDFMDKLTAYSYEYKDPKAPGAMPGRQVGVMAQDVEKSEMGKKFVMDTPQGKMLDMQKGFGTILAAQANLNKRLDEIEKKKKKKV